MKSLLCSILQCGYLDIIFFENLLKEFNLELDYPNIAENHWKLSLNILITSAYLQIKDNFIAANSTEIQRIIEGADPYDIDFTIFTNYLDSHLWFKDEKVEELFQSWRNA